MEVVRVRFAARGRVLVVVGGGRVQVGHADSSRRIGQT